MPDDCNLLIVSDLHLSEGRDPISGKVSRNEDFFFDDDFAAFLHYYQHSPGRWKLIINGDFIDFLQVTAQPATPETDLQMDRVYGLKAGAKESVWKLKRVAQGHQEVFQALSEFAAGNRIAIVSGNHDIEFYFPQVREAFLKELQTRVSKPQQEKIRENVEFFSWFFFDCNLYVEHGHQYDSLNSFAFALEPRLPESRSVIASEQEHVDLPMGSLFVRYLFNRVEVSTPFADNMKPATRFIGWFLTHHPLRATGFLLKEGTEMFRRLKAKWHWVPEVAFSKRQKSHQDAAKILAEKLSQRYPGDWDEILSSLHGLRVAPLMRGPAPIRWKLLRLLIGPIRSPLLLFLVSFVAMGGVLFLLGPIVRPVIPSLLLEYLRSWGALVEPWWSLFGETIRYLFLLEMGLLAIWFFRRRQHSSGNRERLLLRQRAGQIHELLGAKYVVMGHTHEVDLFDSGTEQHYFNTGTWTKVFSKEERVLREEKEFTFVQVTGTGQERQARLMKWEGRSKAARLAYLFDPAVRR
jgi:UDP-2,3-diacylglucosamine pyrophosphatase LpxH